MQRQVTHKFLSSIYLRPYQIDCIDSIRASVVLGNKRVIVKAPCSFGKTIVFCEIARRSSLKNSKVLIIVDNVELVKQTYDKLIRFVDSGIVGIYCASLKSHDSSKIITVSTIQSIKNSKDTFQICIIDEAHEGVSRSVKFVNSRPEMLVIGFTATPYSAKGDPIYGKDKFFETLCYEMSVQKMLEMKMITPTVYGAQRVETQMDLSGVSTVRGDYNEAELQKVYEMQTEKVIAQLDDMRARISDRKKVIIMCVGIKHAEFVAANLQGAITYHSQIDYAERKKIIEQFEKGPYRFLIGVMAIYKGLDIPVVDCLVNMRPCRSKSFYVQFAGRGVRKFEGKENCKFLDYGQTVENLGFYEDIKEKKIVRGKNITPPTIFPKKCPDCLTLIPPQTRTCECGYKFNFNLLSGLTTTAFDITPYQGPKRFYSKVLKVTEVVNGRHLKVVVEDSTQIPWFTKGQPGSVNFYCAGLFDWQIWKYRKIKSKIKEGEYMLWELDSKNWPSFISSHKEKPNELFADIER